MSNRINNKYEYRSGLLDSLKVQHTASDVRNEDEYRKKVLNGLGVEYTDDDINQKSLYRAKVVEGLASSGGGGGSSDFSTAEVTFVNSSALRFKFIIPCAFDGEEETSSYGEISSNNIGSGTTINAILYKGNCFVKLSPIGANTPNIEVSGGIQDMGNENYLITGDCTITIS